MGPANISVDTGVTGTGGVTGAVAVLFAVLLSETVPDDWDSVLVLEAGVDLQEITSRNNTSKIYTQKIFFFINLLLPMKQYTLI
jgi:hypothetical protein